MKVSKSGFSLMEMMVVLLITAIIAAASAPMISKKMVRSISEEGSPWEWVLNGIAYNYGNANNNNTAAIGADHDESQRNSRMYIKTDGTRPQITFGNTNDGSNPNPLSLRFSGSSVLMTNIKPTWSTTEVRFAPDVTAFGYNSEATMNCATAYGHNAKAKVMNSIAIGDSAETNKNNDKTEGVNDANRGEGAIAIGADTQATSTGAIAIGRNRTAGAHANADNAIAIGAQTQATAADSVAIGKRAQATGINAVAIGATATAGENQIVLGTADSTVIIRGRLVVGKNVLLNTDADDARTWFRFDTNGGSQGVGYLARSSTAVDILHGSGLAIGVHNYTGEDGLPSEYSDRRLKNVGKAFTGGLEQVKKLEVFNYTFKKDKAKTPRVGVMAQDLQKIFPNAVVKGDDGFLRIRMEDMFYAVVNAVKELDLKVNNNSKKIAELEKQNKEQQQAITKLEKRLAELEKKVK